MIWITTNGRPSNGALALSKEQGFKRLRTGKGLKPTEVVINWGSSQPLNGVFIDKVKKVLNAPWAIHVATNKLEAFVKMSVQDVKCVEWSDDKPDALKWLEAGHTVVVRTKLTGHSGDGIIIIEPGQDLPDAPLYTRYVFKEKEYRVHVICDKVVDTQRKIKDPDQEVKTWKVRSHANGFIFARQGIIADAVRDGLAVSAVHSLGLDFGAVDIVQDKKGNYYVLEVNTAPGLEGQTVTNYAEAFRAAAG